jgi:hypothetical protein
MGQITNNTLIPLGLAIASIGGGAAWLTTTYKDVEAHTKAIAEIRAEISEDRRDLNKKLDRLTEDTSRIKGMLERHKRSQ